jgi:hypothetical protein
MYWRGPSKYPWPEVLSRHLPEGNEENQGPKANRCGGADSNSVHPDYKSDNSVRAKCSGEFIFFSILVARIASSSPALPE